MSMDLDDAPVPIAGGQQPVAATYVHISFFFLFYFTNFFCDSLVSCVATAVPLLMELLQLVRFARTVSD